MRRGNRDRWIRITLAVGILSSTGVLSATPSVLAGGTPYLGTYGFNSAESPTTPLLVTYSDTVGSNTVFGEAAPGRLRASSEIVNGALDYHQSLGKAEFTDHFHLANPGQPINSTATFIYTFFLTGTMKIKADVSAVSAVSINAYGPGDDPVGHLEVSQSGSIARLYGLGGETGGPGYPMNNIFAEADGSMKIYQTATATGTGDAAFGSEFGVIESLAALDETSFPDGGLLNGDFPHGFFSFDVTGVTAGAAIGLGIALPAVVAPDTKWWFKDPDTGWRTLPTVTFGGIGFIIVTASDDLAGDVDPTPGTLSLLGGPGVAPFLFANGFEDGTTGAWSNSVP